MRPGAKPGAPLAIPRSSSSATFRRAKHIEVQVLGDNHGNVIHLHERDCSVQRRHQKVIEIAPSVDLKPGVVRELCDAAARMAREIGYNNAGTVEFLFDLDRNEWFFIEMNPRIQVEHTVTEVITGIDLVRSQILIANGAALDGPELALPPQDAIPRNGYAVQARITTEDPDNKFMPSYGKILTYRSAAGFGIRLDGGMGDTGARHHAVLRFPAGQAHRLRAVLRHRAPAHGPRAARVPHPRREDEHPLPGKRHPQRDLPHRPGHDHGSSTPPRSSSSSRAAATAPRSCSPSSRDVTVNGNPQAKGHIPADPAHAGPAARLRPQAGRRPTARASFSSSSARRNSPNGPSNQKQLLVTDTTFRDAHQSLFATRVRTYDMLAVADAVARRTPRLVLAGDVGRRHLRHRDALPPRGPVAAACAPCASASRISASRCSSAAATRSATRITRPMSSPVSSSTPPTSGIDIFRIFDSLNYTPEPQGRHGGRAATRTPSARRRSATPGDILDPAPHQVFAEYYVKMAKELERMGAHFLAIKDMAGLCRPYAAHALVKALKEEIGIPIHFHTHDTSGVNAASVLQASDAGVDIVDLALASMSGSTSPAQSQFHRRRPPAHPARHRARPRRAQRVQRLLGAGPRLLRSPSTPRPRSGSAEVYLHEMPGGQFTNLKEQAASMGLGHRWPEIARCYAEVNQLFGDIVKVTPSQQGRRRHGALPLHPRHQAGGRGQSPARHVLPGIRHRHALRRPRQARSAAGRSKVVAAVLGDRKPASAQARRRSTSQQTARELADEAQARGHRRRSLQPPHVPRGLRRVRPIRRANTPMSACCRRPPFSTA